MNKRSCLALLFFILINAASYAQFKILLVKDEDLNFGNTDTLRTALQATGNPVSFFSIPDSNRAPTLTELKKYALVVWYTASDGVDLKFWSIANGDTSVLAQYITQGGKLWVAGLDFLYNKYGAPPVTFQTSEFANKYLGIGSYDAQSYGSDGGLGVPQAVPGPQSPYNTPAVLQWVYATLWWADGCTPNSTSVASYIMGPSTYSLYGKACEIAHLVNVSPVVSTFFDPAMIDTYSNRLQYIKKVLAFFTENVTPVELSSFTAAAAEKRVTLAWETKSETNNSHFIVERATDSKNFTAVGRVAGNGNTASGNHYTFTDNTEQSGFYYYRLQQVDFDGSTTYSAVVTAEINAVEGFALEQNYPNPFNPTTSIRFSIPFATKVSITVFNELGQKVALVTDAVFEAGSHSVQWNASNMPSGVYFYELRADNYRVAKKLSLMK